jgi:hypothetical protein
MPSWELGYPSWVVQDRIYPEFKQGQVADFAVAVLPSDPSPVLAPARSRQLEVEALGDALYRVQAEVHYSAYSVMVLDFGLRVYLEYPRLRAGEGDILAGTVALEIDGFPDIEKYAGLPGMPPPVYTRHIDRIVRSIGDDVAEVAQTDTFGRDGGRAAWYVLHCSLLDRPPMFWSRTATVAQAAKTEESPLFDIRLHELSWLADDR